MINNFCLLMIQHCKTPLYDTHCSDSLTPTLKIDGTSCLIDTYNGRPWLWARHDVKPNKEGDKKFKEWKQSQQEQEISNNKDLASVLDVHVDFKNFPEDWKSATGMYLLSFHFNMSI